MTLPPEYDPVTWASQKRDTVSQTVYSQKNGAQSFNTYQNDPFVVATEASLIKSNRNYSEVLSICFDPVHELLWTANAAGRITGFDVEQLKCVNSFGDLRTAILQIDVYDEAIAAITNDTFFMYNRHGQCCLRHQNPQFEQLRCVHRPSPHQSNVFLGGLQKQLTLFDFDTQRQVRSIVDDLTSVTMMRSNQSNLICANDQGIITVRSLSGDKVSEIQAHLGPITGFDVCGNKLVTAGCTIKSGFGTPRGDPFLKVFDLRFMSASQPMQTPFPPEQVYFGDPHTGTVIMTSHFGHLWSGNINNTSQTQSIQAMPYGSGSFNHLTMSSSKRCIATVDSNQYGRVYSPYNPTQGFYGVVNYRSRPMSPHQYYHKEPLITGFRGNPMSARMYNPARVQQDFHGSPMPMVMGGTSSDMVSDVADLMGGFSLDPTGVRINDAANDKTRSNAVYIIKRAGAEAAKNIYSEGLFRDVHGLSRTLMMPEWVRAQNELPVPRFYTRPSDKDRHVKAIYERYNGTCQVALLTNADAPIVNSFIRALAAVPPIRKLILSHLCRRRNCILCEMQFIVRNIHTQEADSCITPITCNAIVREMSAYADFGIIKEFTATQFCGLTSTLFCNFFLQHIFLESTLAYDDDAAPDLHLDSIMKMSLEKSSLCSSCGSAQKTLEKRHVINLKYPATFFDGRHVPFVQLLQESFDDTTTGEMQIPQCSMCFRRAPRFVNTNSRLPSVLVVDTAINREGYAFWNQNADSASHRPVSSMSIYDPRFSREGSPHNHVVNFHERTLRGVSDAVHSGGKFDNYVPSMISAVMSNNGKVTFSGSINKDGNNKVYALCSAVMSIADGNDRDNFISICKGDNPQSPALNWTVFNDYIVTPVKVDEALYTHSSWKLPQVLFFCDIDMLNVEPTPVPIPRAVFSDEYSVNGGHARASPPEPGEIVALDSEFIQNEIKEHVLGRVSCLNSAGEPIIDDYSLLGCNEVISDYLTQFSGIAYEDLNPATSTKYLLSRKKSYLKVLYLVENKNVFVGHALHNDFRILNIYIPSEQIIDTCELYRLDGKQCLSLRALVDHVFGETIQSSRHDSVEDALCALRLFKKYKKQEEENANINAWLRQIYDETQKRSAQDNRRHIVAPRSNQTNSGYLSYM